MNNAGMKFTFTNKYGTEEIFAASKIDAIVAYLMPRIPNADASTEQAIRDGEITLYDTECRSEEELAAAAAYAAAHCDFE